MQWNFETSLVASDVTVVARFRPQVTPDSGEVTTSIENPLSANEVWCCAPADSQVLAQFQTDRTTTPLSGQP